MFSSKEFTTATTKLVGQVKDQHLECCCCNVCTEWNLLSRNLLHAYLTLHVTRLSLLAGSECGESKDSKKNRETRNTKNMCEERQVLFIFEYCTQCEIVSGKEV